MPPPQAPTAPVPVPEPEPEPVEAPPTADAVSGTDPDPHRLGVALDAILGGSRRTARTAAIAAATQLLDGETVEIALGGRFLGHDGVAILTDRRLLLANGRSWDPEIVSVDALSTLGVEGWVERRSATLRLTDGADVHVIDRINDTGVAESLANALRAR